MRGTTGESQVSEAWHPDPVLEPRFRWSFPDSRPIDPALLAEPLGSVLDVVLARIEADYGRSTAGFVALQLEYPRGAVTNGTVGRQAEEFEEGVPE